MHFKLLEYTTDSFVLLLQRMFRHLREIENVDVEVLRFQRTEEPRVASAFQYDGRHYPAIVVMAQGGNLQFLDLADHVGVVVDTLEYGKEPQQYGVISGSYQITAQFVPSGSMEVERISAFMRHAPSTGESDVTVSIREDNSNTPSDTVLASGVIPGFVSEGWTRHEGYLEESVTLTEDVPYWVVFSGERGLPFGGTYHIGRQTGYGENHRWAGKTDDADWVVDTDSALSMSVLGQSYERIGAAARLTVQVSCAAKDDEMAMRLSDLSHMYLFLARKRGSGFLRNRHVDIVGIRIGALTRMDPTEEQPDPIYVARLFVDCKVEFWEDFAVDILKSLEIEVEAY